MFCSIAAGAIGITSFHDFAVYTALGWFYKTAVEVVMLPITLSADRLHQAARAHLHRDGVMTAPVIRNYGDRALLLECGSIDDVLALAAELRAAELPGVADIVPARAPSW